MMIEVSNILTVIHLRDDLLISGLLITQILDEKTRLLQIIPYARANRSLWK